MASYYICVLITIASAFTSLGFSAQAVRAANNEQISALYAATRSVALAIVSLAPLFYHSKPFLVAIAIAMIIIQALDAAIGFTIKNQLKTYGPIATALFNLLALVWLLK
jgi:hypothetical protein